MTGRSDRLQQEFQIAIRWSAFPLHPEIPEEGLTLEQLFAGRNFDLNEVMARLERAARDAGLPFTRRTMTYNSRPAQELSKWAETRGRGHDFHQAVFRAYFVAGKNIGKADVLTGLVRDLGLPPEEARQVLADRLFKEAVDADWDRSRQIGITAVPTFILEDKALVGAQPYEKLAALLETAGVRKRHEA
ncbi:MAG: DsbA family protein [Deltaproteobacteria bacterium]|nr:DsbA family protein [Deltaproteobacteria bacterium]